SDDRRLGDRAGHLAHRDPAKLDVVLRLEVAEPANSNDDQARNLETRRCHDVEAGAALALEALGGGRPGHQTPSRGKHLAGGRAELEALVTEHNKNPLRGRRQWRKFKLQGHANSLNIPRTGLPATNP